MLFSVLSRDTVFFNPRMRLAPTRSFLRSLLSPPSLRYLESERDGIYLQVRKGCQVRFWMAPRPAPAKRERQFERSLEPLSSVIAQAPHSLPVARLSQRSSVPGEAARLGGRGRTQKTHRVLVGESRSKLRSKFKDERARRGANWESWLSFKRECSKVGEREAATAEVGETYDSNFCTLKKRKRQKKRIKTSALDPPEQLPSSGSAFYPSMVPWGASRLWFKDLRAGALKRKRRDDTDHSVFFFPLSSTPAPQAAALRIPYSSRSFSHSLSSPPSPPPNAGRKPAPSSSLEVEKDAPLKKDSGKPPTTAAAAPPANSSPAAAAAAEEAPPSTSSPAAPLPLSLLPATYAQLARDFAILGWTAFGGPSAHVAQFVLLFTEGGKRRWLSTSVFAELFALAQCVPGPSSTQLAYG